MKKLILLIALFLACSVSISVNAQSTMTDNQVLDYVKEAMATGKSRQVMITELAARGVNRAQVERVKKLYESQIGGTNEKQSDAENTDSTREHALNVDVQIADAVMDTDESDHDTFSDEVWGRNIFKNKNLSFKPSANTPTPKNYVLGAGDEVIIDLYGANQTTMRQTISPEGNIVVDVLGPVYLSGKSIDEANNYLKQRLSVIYNGLNADDAGYATDIQLSLGRIRSIQVDVLGDAEQPGTYMVSSLSTVFHALHEANGIKDPGSVRSIKVVRNGRKIAVIDIYDFLITGNKKDDVRLEDGDVILIEPYKTMVSINGYVNRAMNFEMKEGETVADLLTYAGGFSKSASEGSVTVIRQQDRDYKVFTVNSAEFASFVLQNGDEIEVGKFESRFDNRVSIKGTVYKSGVYELGSEIKTVKQLVSKAGGLLPEAFTNRAVLYRERDDRSLEVLPIDLYGILNGTKSDIGLRNNDELFVPSIYELKDRGILTISGDVAQPGTFPYADNCSLEDLIIQAGGLLRSASTVRVDVSRRIVDSESLQANSDISTLYTFTINPDFTIEGATGFMLQPYDEVIVRRSPSYVNSKFVTISGEVNFPGRYAMSKREERVSDLIEKAGGVNQFAYVHGARLWRVLSKTERLQAEDAMRSMQFGNDSVYLSENDTIAVSIELDKALANPGSVYDMVLREGDVLDIPVLNTTVKIYGAVQMPSTVIYRPGLKKKDYIASAGGYMKGARRTKVFAVSMNGTVKPLNRFSSVEPGSSIYVPMKKKKERNMATTMATMTSMATLGTMLVTLINVLK